MQIKQERSDHLDPDHNRVDLFYLGHDASASTAGDVMDNGRSFFTIRNEEESKRISSTPCCGVLAVAVCANAPFTKVWEMMKEQKGVGHQWRGRTNHNDLRKALTAFKVRWVEEMPPYTTLATWVDQHAVKSQMYLVRTGGHFQVVLKGAVVDQRGIASIKDYWGHRKMVTSAWRIQE